MNIELLEKVGVTQADVASLPSLEKMQRFYETLNKSLMRERDAAKTDDANPIRDEFRKNVSEDETVKLTAETAMANVRAILSDAMESSPLSAILLADLLRNLASEVAGEKNYQETLALADENIPAPTIELPDDWSERRDEAMEVAKTIRLAFQLASQFGTDIVGAVANKETKFKVKESKDASLNFIQPVLSKLVRDISDETETALVGRAALNSRIIYSWNGTQLSTSVMKEVLHDYVSDFRGGYVVSLSDFRDIVKENKFSDVFAAAKAGAMIEMETGTLGLSIQEV